MLQATWLPLSGQSNAFIISTMRSKNIHSKGRAPVEGKFCNKSANPVNSFQILRRVYVGLSAVVPIPDRPRLPFAVSDQRVVFTED
jgi:hypothetical protein